MNPATAKIVAGRWDSIVIPDHLRFKDVRDVPNPYAGVTSRYRSPPKRAAPADPLQAEREKAAAAKYVNPHFAMVESRYRSPPKSPTVRPSADDVPLSKSESVRMTKEYVAHKQHSAVFQHVPSKFFDLYTMQAPPKATRREEIDERLRQQKLSISKEGQVFTPIVGRCRSPTAAEIVQPLRKKAGHSVVMEWVRDGVPIPTSRPADPPKPRVYRKEIPFMAPGGAGGGSFARRTTSPTRVALASEERLVASVKERLQHPSRLSTEVATRLQRPSPSRTSPTRTISPNRRTASATPSPVPPQARSTTRQMHIDPQVVRPQGTPSPRRTTRPVEVRADCAPTPASGYRSSPVRGVKRDEVDIHISLVSDISELSDAPRISVSSRRPPVPFQGPPCLASP